MKKLNILISALFMGFCIFGSEVIFASRLEKHKMATQEFKNLHFYSDGGGMHLVPGAIEVFDKLSKVSPEQLYEMLGKRWGLNIQEKEIIGLFNVTDQNLKIGAMGCVACHSGKAAGQLIIGLGNKNIDVLQLGKDARLVQYLYKDFFGEKNKTPFYLEVEKSALEFADLLSNSKLGNFTQGIVPVSFIRTWFYKQANQEWPSDMTRGGVKVPALWGYGVKRNIGQFSDGFGDGTLPGWAIAVELTAGQKPEVVRKYLDKVWHAEELFSDFLPPPYPFEIDHVLADKGKNIFIQTCQRCHGSYSRDGEGYPEYQVPKYIPIAVVQTDDDRLKANTEEFRKLVATNPLSDILKATEFGEGYFAPRLDGIWARFPYLHNASVPNVMALLTPPANRPEYFSLSDSGEVYRFDKKNLGLTVPKKGSMAEKALKLKSKISRNVYSTKKVGQSSRGHNFGMHLSYNEKLALIEYLKTL